MALQIKQGLFSNEFTDYYAILGVSVDADFKEVRKRYLQIARRLHPDSIAAADAAEKQQASEFLSKLVNPAYEKLSKEKERAEYLLLLKLKGQQAAQNPSAFPINSATGKQLSQASDPEQNYKTLLQELANQQYESLGQLLEVTGQISELNLVYVMRREQQARVVPAFTPQTVPTSNVPGAGAKPPQSVATVPEATVTPPSKVDQRAYIEQYCRRAEDLIAKNQFAAAIKELRDALKDDPTYSRCHALLGTVYLKQNQLTMARISFDQALKFDPQNPAALDGKREVEKLMKTQGAGKGTTQKTTPQTGKPGKSGGGLFGGLFGGKK